MAERALETESRYVVPRALFMGRGVHPHSPNRAAPSRRCGTVFPARSPQVKLTDVRKQYSFWAGEDGLDAWDVDKLIELARNLPVEEIALESIDEIDSNYWFSDKFWPPTVRLIVEHVQLIQEVETSYPIILGPEGRVMDGMHRIARAMLDGRSTIAAVRLAVLPPPDYRNCLPKDLPY
jgi:hypothetical protein